MEVLFNLFSKNSLGICMVDAGGNCVNMNDTFCEILDIQKKQFIGAAFNSIFPDGYFGKKPDLFQLLYNGVNRPLIGAIKKPDGTSAFVTMNADRIHSAARGLLYVTIRQMKQIDIEKETVLESITDGFFMMDKNSILTFINKEGERKLKVSRADVIGKSLWSVLPMGENSVTFQEFRRAIKENIAVHFEDTCDPLNIVYEANAYPSELGLSVYFKDITENKHLLALEQLEREVLEMNALPDSTLGEIIRYYLEGMEKIHSGMSCSIMRLEGNRLYLWEAPTLPKAFTDCYQGMEIGNNRGSCGTAAFLKQKVIVSDIENDPRWAIYKPYAAKFGYKSCWSFPIVSNKGTVLGTFSFYQKINGAPDLKQEHSISGAVNILKIIIENKLFEGEIMELNDELKNRADALTKSNEELERFAYVASHDLQEPLRMVTGFLQLLQKQYDAKLDESAKKYISLAVDGASRMKRLISDLLQFSRITSSTMALSPVDTNEIVNELKELFKMNLQVSKGEIIAEKLPIIVSDRTSINQLLQNLIGNALKYYSPDRPPVVRISCKEDDTEWKFTIEDNGIGIDPKFFEKIFVIFQRLHNKETYSGTGIGLAICKKIVERLHGRIWLESEPGKGSTFYFSIPKN